MNKQEIFLRRQETIIVRGVYKIMREQEKGLIAILEREQKSYERKSIEDDIIEYLETIKIQIPAYLYSSLQGVMQKAYKQAFKPWKSYLQDYRASLVFNIETEPAVRYLRSMETLHLSQNQGSINKTTQKEILTILREGVSSGESYTSIAKKIQTTDPFVFSKSRARLIATQETGKAYGWANYNPAKQMQEQGYKMGKIWATSRDGMVRDTHFANQEEGLIPIEQIWTATGDMYAPSTDFNCRCTSTYKIIG